MSNVDLQNKANDYINKQQRSTVKINTAFYRKQKI